MTQTQPARQFHAKGKLAEQETLQEGGAKVTLEVPETSYRLELLTLKPVDTPVGKPIAGTIRVSARRVDVVRTGGRYIEPVFGRPRRVQGRVLSIDGGTNSITVQAGVPVVLKLNRHQRADAFQLDDLVSCDVLPGATFSPEV